MASKISIASSALVLIGHTPIQSFDDGTAGAQVATQFYEESYKSLLQMHRWRFATKQAELSKLSQEPVLSGYSNVFQLPTDMLYLQGTERTMNYEIFEDKLFTNHNSVKVNYTFRVNEDKLPAYFVTMLEFYLASKFSIPVTGNASRAQTYMVAYEKERLKAKNADSSQRPNRPIRSNPFLDVRYS